MTRSPDQHPIQAQPPVDSIENALQHAVLATCQPSGFVSAMNRPLGTGLTSKLSEISNHLR
jgi:hypothetical protein